MVFGVRFAETLAGAGGTMPQSISDIFAANVPNDLGKRIVAAT